MKDHPLFISYIDLDDGNVASIYGKEVRSGIIGVSQFPSFTGTSLSNGTFTSPTS